MGNNIQQQHQQQPVNKEETITVYAAPGSDHCEEPPTQVVRANPAQLVVTDRPAGQNPTGQLQLPQKPQPPGLGKPAPGKVCHIYIGYRERTRGKQNTIYMICWDLISGNFHFKQFKYW